MNWKKVEDSVPDTNIERHGHFSSKSVLVKTEKGEFHAALCRLDSGNSAWFKTGTYHKLNVTHWAELPDPTA